MTKKNCFPERTGTLKKSIPDNPITMAVRLYDYNHAHDYKDKGFPRPLQREINMMMDVSEKSETDPLLRKRIIWFNNIIRKRLKKMTEQLSDKEKALLILEKAKNAFNECGKQLRETQTAFMKLTSAVETANDNLKRVLNEEENNGNIHKDCEYYHQERDFCGNYLMGQYSSLAFEVSRHKSCIKDLVE